MPCGGDDHETHAVHSVVECVKHSPRTQPDALWKALKIIPSGDRDSEEGTVLGMVKFMERTLRTPFETHLQNESANHSCRGSRR